MSSLYNNLPSLIRRPMTYTDKKDMAHVVMSANSLRRGNPTTLKVSLHNPTIA